MRFYACRTSISALASSVRRSVDYETSVLRRAASTGELRLLPRALPPGRHVQDVFSMSLISLRHRVVARRRELAVTAFRDAVVTSRVYEPWSSCLPPRCELVARRLLTVADAGQRSTSSSNGCLRTARLLHLLLHPSPREASRCELTTVPRRKLARTGDHQRDPPRYLICRFWLRSGPGRAWLPDRARGDARPPGRYRAERAATHRRR